MTTAKAYWRLTGLTMIGVAAGLAVMFAAVVRLSIPLGLLALMITIVSVAVAVPSTLAAQQLDADAERARDVSEIPRV